MHPRLSRAFPLRSTLVALALGAASEGAFASDADDACEGHEYCEPVPEECPTTHSLYYVDVPKALLRGAFRVNGQVPIPWDSQSGRIELRSDTLGTVDLGPVHEGAYSAFVIPGDYDVVYTHRNGTLVPANSESLLARDLKITGGKVDFNVPSVLVTGDLTLNGGAFPASYYEVGTVLFRDRETGAAFTVGVSHEGDYSVLVMPGT